MVSTAKMGDWSIQGTRILAAGIRFTLDNVEEEKQYSDSSNDIVERSGLQSLYCLI